MPAVEVTVSSWRIQSGAVYGRVSRTEDDTWVGKVYGASVFVPLVEFPVERAALEATEDLVRVLAEQNGDVKEARQRGQAAVAEFRERGRP